MVIDVDAAAPAVAGGADFVVDVFLVAIAVVVDACADAVNSGLARPPTADDAEDDHDVVFDDVEHDEFGLCDDQLSQTWDEAFSSHFGVASKVLNEPEHARCDSGCTGG